MGWAIAATLLGILEGGAVFLISYLLAKRVQ